MATSIVSVKIPPKLLEAAERHAKKAGLPVSTWIRGLVEEKTGVHVELPQGFAAMPKQARQEAGAKGTQTKRNRKAQSAEPNES